MASKMGKESKAGLKRDAGGGCSGDGDGSKLDLQCMMLLTRAGVE